MEVAPKSFKRMVSFHTLPEHDLKARCLIGEDTVKYIEVESVKYILFFCACVCVCSCSLIPTASQTQLSFVFMFTCKDGGSDSEGLGVCVWE